MKLSLPDSLAELKSFLSRLDKFLLDKALEWARKCYKTILEELDQLIGERRGKGLSIEHRREVWYQTCLGTVKVKRRQYRDEEGR